MKRLICGVIVLFCFLGCKKDNTNILNEGNWLVELSVLDNQKLPFNLKLEKNIDGTYEGKVYNADEIIVVDEINVYGDSILIQMPVFEGYLKGEFSKNFIKGNFIKESLNRIVPFTATHGIEKRFTSNKTASELISGVWETNFSPGTPEEYLGKGIFVQNGNKVTGTFRTTTGDYRYLDGLVYGDSVKLSAFDGAHAFLFTAKIVNDSTLNGMFYSGNHFKEPFVAKRNEVFELPNEDSLTFLKKGYETFNFSFPNDEGQMIALSDNEFQNKPVVVQVMGTWCPNCLDETKFLVSYLKENKNTELKVVALAFEYAKTEEEAYKSIKRLKDRIGVEYPILLAQYGDADKDIAQKKLPMLNHVLSYPTTIFIDKKGLVRKIKTGFNGPATGDKFLEFKKEFNSIVEALENE